MGGNERVVCNLCWDKLKPYNSTKIKDVVTSDIDVIFPVFLFDEHLQSIIHLLKYQGNKSVGIQLGQIMAQNILPKIKNEIQNFVISPIPLHPVKLRERGYNQSEAIALGLSEELHISANMNLLKRIVNTKTQTKLNRSERMENVKNAFVMNKIDIIPKAVILIDDVFTTGSTMNSAARVLKNQGVSVVYGISAAAPIIGD